MSQTPLVKLEWDAATELVNQAGRIYMVTHVRPDGDAIGSMCGLGLALKEQGKTVYMSVDDGINDYLSYVPGSDLVWDEAKPHKPDLVISLDASDAARIGENGATLMALDCPKIVVDHHATNIFFGDVHIVHSDYVSTTEAVLRWLDHMGWAISQPVAQALMVGFMTDTISFRVGPVTADTLAQVSRLMSLGADMKGAIENMLLRTDAHSLQLTGVGLSRLQIEEHVTWTYLQIDDFKKLGIATSDKPELATEILRNEQAYIAAYFVETEAGEVRLSLRATAGFDVGSIAKDLGGGGHTLASGATLADPDLESAIARVIPILKTEAQRGTPVYK